METEVDTENMESFFQPGGVAVAGISGSNDQKMGNIIASLLHAMGRRDLFLLNPKGGKVVINDTEFPLYKSMTEVKEDIDLVIVTVPIAAMLIQFGISRSREYKADAGGARIAGNPDALASALEKLDYVGKRRPMRMGSPASSGLFIANPFHDSSIITGLFSTHPPMERRVRKLRELAMYNR